MGKCGEGKFIIGLSGIPGSGKTTIAQILEKERGYRRLSFGGHLKETAKFIYGIEDRFIYGTQADKEEIIPSLGISGRFILQRLGTEVCRTIHPETWVMAVQNQIISDSVHSRFVVDDVRFQNELEFVTGFNQGEVWRIDRTEPNTRHSLLKAFLGKVGIRWKSTVHIAERPDLLKGISKTIQNTGSLEDLQTIVLQLVGKIEDEKVSLPRD